MDKKLEVEEGGLDMWEVEGLAVEEGLDDQEVPEIHWQGPGKTLH